jgi:hypothetical protein
MVWDMGYWVDLGFGFSLPIIAAWWQLYVSSVVLTLDIRMGSISRIHRSLWVNLGGFRASYVAENMNASHLLD